MMKGWACCVLICHQQKRTFGGWRTSSRDLAYFRVSCDILRSSRKRSSPCVPTTVVVLKQPSQSIHTSREAYTFRRRFRLPYVAPKSSPPCWRIAKWYHQILQKVQNLMPHDCIPSCTIYTVVQQYALVDYDCCFHLTSGTSTAAVCVCFFSSHSFWTSSALDVPAGVSDDHTYIHRRTVTQDFSSTFFVRCVP